MEQQTPDQGVQKQAKGGQANAQIRLLRLILPKIPFIFRILISHLLHLSESARYLDLRSDLTVALLRNILSTGKAQPISKTQAFTLRDPGVKGRIWVSTVASKVPPEPGIRDALLAAIHSSKADLVPDGEPCRIPDIMPVEAEWTGYRAAATPDSAPPQISEEEKYHEMMKECKSLVTVLYFHGGAYYLLDPCSHRPTTKKLAKFTKGRVYSVRYRLAPQNPFPSALLDALVSYFTLLYPPPDAVHDAVSPSNIVFAGDSAGGNLSLALLQTILQMRRQNIKVTWFGVEREVPLPAGAALASPWLDMVQSLPSWKNNTHWDYLPPPNVIAERPPTPDSIWPASPPRKHLYVDDAYMLHPLACLHLAQSWEGSPPIYVSTGWECLADEDRYLVAKLTKEGVPVVFEEYEAMPHVFAPILSKTPQSKRCYEGWARFITAAVENPQSIKSSYTTIKARMCEEVNADPGTLTPFTEDDLRKLAFEMVGRKLPISEVPAKL